GFAVIRSQGRLIPVLLGLAMLILLLCAGELSFSRQWFALGRTLSDSLAMRREIRYALSLTNWLKYEGARCASVEELYEDLTLAARRLGFTSVNLQLADGERCWKQRSVCAPLLSARHALRGGMSGVLELKAPVCRLTRGPGERNGTWPQACKRPCCPSLS